ncbi:MAG TPA: SRPBCC family protein [Desulfuromonadaceae bacterium]|nr:SRPBCC family protein [Desulfuromonadaceae bacterium]
MQKPKLVYTTYIRSTPKAVWAAITKPEFTRKYWGDMSNASDWEKGSDWQHLNPDNEVWIKGKVVESRPPTKLVLSWIDPDKTADKSRVTFEIEPAGKMVCLVVTHDRFSKGSDMDKKVSKGWPMVLSSLKSYLETGKGLDIFCKG